MMLDVQRQTLWFNMDVSTCSCECMAPYYVSIWIVFYGCLTPNYNQIPPHHKPSQTLHPPLNTSPMATVYYPDHVSSATKLGWLLQTKKEVVTYMDLPLLGVNTNGQCILLIPMDYAVHFDHFIWREKIICLILHNKNDCYAMCSKRFLVLQFFFLFFLLLMDLPFLLLCMDITSHGHPCNSLWLVLSLTHYDLDAIPLLGSSLLELCLMSPLTHLWMP